MFLYLHYSIVTYSKYMVVICRLIINNYAFLRDNQIESMITHIGHLDKPVDFWGNGTSLLPPCVKIMRGSFSVVYLLSWTWNRRLIYFLDARIDCCIYLVCEGIYWPQSYDSNFLYYCKLYLLIAPKRKSTGSLIIAIRSYFHRNYIHLFSRVRLM